MKTEAVQLLSEGDVLMSELNFDGAIEKFRAALELEPESKEVISRLNEAANEKNDLKFTHSGKLTKLEIEALRKANNLEKGDITHVFVYANDAHKVHSYYKPGSQGTIAKAVSLYHQDMVLESGQTLLINNFIGGDESVKTNEKLNISTAMKLKDSALFLGGGLEKI